MLIIPKKLPRHKMLFASLIIVLFMCQQSVFSLDVDPDDFHGVRTKWLIDPQYPISGQSRHSIIPQLSDLEVAEFMRHLESTGANSITLNLEARNGMKHTEPKHDTYSLTPLQINSFEYTAGQRNILLTDFLLEVQRAIHNKEILGTIKFHIHQRLYPNENKGKEDEFITDFSNFINLAKARGVDQLIAGIRLGEHGTNGREYLLNLAIRTAKEINENTEGWLKERGGLEWSGDAYGRLFKNIHSQSNSASFFEEIQKHTGYFAFCFKAFGLKADLNDLGYDQDKIEDWYTYFNDDLGFKHLKQYIDTYKQAYPLHANVIYIGDSGDALKQVSDNEYEVTTTLFQEAGVGFQGIIAVNGYRRPDKTEEDNYLYLYDALENKRPPVLKEQSLFRWQNWPEQDTHVENRHLITINNTLGGITSPSGPMFVNGQASISIDIESDVGYQLDSILINGVPQELNNPFVIDSVTDETKVLIHFGKTQEDSFNRLSMDSLQGSWSRNDKGKFLHFYSNGRCSDSETETGEETDFGVWWFDSKGNGSGEIIQMFNDNIKLLSVKADSASSGQITVTYPDETVHTYTKLGMPDESSSSQISSSSEGEISSSDPITMSSISSETYSSSSSIDSASSSSEQAVSSADEIVLINSFVKSYPKWQFQFCLSNDAECFSNPSSIVGMYGLNGKVITDVSVIAPQIIVVKRYLKN